MTVIDITKRVMADIESDPEIDAWDIMLEESGRGFTKKKTLRVSGVVSDGAQKDRLLKLVQRRAGDSYAIMDNLFVSELLWDA